MNGFDVIPELVTIEVDEEHIAPFSLPQEALTFTPGPNTVVNHFSNGDCERMIFCNTELEEHEQEWLRKCQEQAKKEGLSFLPSVTVAAGRFLGDVKGDVEISLRRMRDSQTWRQNFFRDGPITISQIKEDIGLGILYFCGRDKELRPALVVRPARTPPELNREDSAYRFNRLFMFCMEYFLRYMVVPGKVENICVILDLKNIALSQVPSIATLMEIKTVLSMQNAGRVFRFYVVNMPIVLRMLSGIVQGAMTERQRQKIRFVTNWKDLRSEFALHHLEEDLGGTRPIVNEFLPFPLLPGSFDGNCDSGPSPDAVPHVHRVLTAAGARGRLWDKNKSHEENTRLEFSEMSDAILRDILREGGLPPPKGKGSATLTEAKAAGAAGQAAEAHAKRRALWVAGSDQDVKEVPAVPAARGAMPGASAPHKGVDVAAATTRPIGSVVMDTEEVRPRSMLSCVCRLSGQEKTMCSVEVPSGLRRGAGC